MKNNTNSFSIAHYLLFVVLILLCVGLFWYILTNTRVAGRSIPTTVINEEISETVTLPAPAKHKK